MKWLSLLLLLLLFMLTCNVINFLKTYSVKIKIHQAIAWIIYKSSTLQTILIKYYNFKIKGTRYQ